MRDFRTWFIDAHGGEVVHRIDHVRAESAAGYGTGITGAPQKLSVWHNGHDYEAWDRLRPAESADAIGFHAGLDLVRYFNDTVGLGGVLRYSSASIDLDAPDGGSIEVDGGGLQIVVDLRFRF